MKILNREFIFKPEGSFEWSRSHAQVPFAFELDDKTRVYFATRDKQSRSSVAFIDVHKNDPTKVLYVHDKPVLFHGKDGDFDDSGTMPSWFVKNEDHILMYYTAWNKSETASYRLSIGIARSDDNGLNFKKLFKGPILDRSKYDPIWVGQPCVLKIAENDWRMWYLSCEKIEMIDNHPEPFYNVKYATSQNGIDWIRNNEICIDFDANTDAIGRPCVWLMDDDFFMLHSNRRANGYRKDKMASYRLELSSSQDGINWKKKSDFNFIKSNSGWDSIMNEYTSIVKTSDSKYLVYYNGNGFGESGFGKFELEF